MQKPSIVPLYRISMASITSMISAAFFAVEYRDCWMGTMAYFSAFLFQLARSGLVKSPYIL